MIRNAALLWFLAVVGCSGKEFEIVNATGTNIIIIHTNAITRIWWIQTGQSCYTEGSPGVWELRPSWQGGAGQSWWTVTNGHSRVVALREGSGYKLLSCDRDWDREHLLADLLTWLSSGFGLGLAMWGSGWCFRIVRASFTSQDPEP